MKSILIYLFFGWTFAPILHFVEKYIFNDWQYLKFLFVICFADTILGMVKAVKAKELSSKGFSMIFNKIIIYSTCLIATHVLAHFSVNNVSYSVFSYFDSIVFSAIMVREGISIFENIALLDPMLLPTGLLKYLKQFDSMTGKAKVEGEEKVTEDS